MFKLGLKEMSALIGIGLVLMIVAGALLNYLDNPIWINIFLGTIIFTGLITLLLYLLFLWEFIEQRQRTTIMELELELERIKRR